MRRRFLSIVIAAVMVSVGGLVTSQVKASPGDEYTVPHFGAGNTPPGCEADVIPTTAETPPNVCHHMKTDLNSLDSNNIDVLIAVPASPFAERDLRIMRQSVEMWAGGVEYLAPQMGLDWMKDVNFEISTDVVSFANGTPIYTYPIVDPEIVIIASNPAGGAGIGIDPLSTPAVIVTPPDSDPQPIPPDAAGWPCHGLANPFDIEAWEAVPGFDNHHRSNSGTYSAPCSETGGNICFAVNGAIDPAPDTAEIASLFDLVSHEFGHCLTVGHVGDGGECVITNVCWGNVPTNDIMSYSGDPAGLNKCVSTLDVEALATTQSKFIDTNGDGAVTPEDKVDGNDPVGEPGDDQPFQTQHPRDHLYASGTGSPTDCPQPDLGLVPGPRTDWTPDEVPTSRKELHVTSPADGASSSSGAFNVAGTVENVKLGAGEPDPTGPSGSHDDADDDASSPITEITEFSAEVTAETVEATLTLAEMPPGGADAQSPTSYTFVVDGRAFDSFVYPTGPPSTFDTGAGQYADDSFSSWDVEAKQVNFHIPRAYLANAGITAPYFVSSSANFGAPASLVTDDTSPDEGTIGLAAPGAPAGGTAALAIPGAVRVQQNLGTVEFRNGEDPQNTFHVEDSSGDLYPIVFNGDRYTLDVGANPRDVTVTLDWTDNVGGTDLDLRVTGAADSEGAGATINHPETVTFTGVSGVLNLEVNPYIVTDPEAGTTYTLTAVVTGDVVLADSDGDGVPDEKDACPHAAGTQADGCPANVSATAEFVHVYLDDSTSPLGTEAVDTSNGKDAYAIAVTVPQGKHTLKVVWERFGRAVASESVAVERTASSPPPSGKDTDKDGVADAVDNCRTRKNPGQYDLDKDGQGDACDTDMDGDGFTNVRERRAGTDPRNANSHP